MASYFYCGTFLSVLLPNIISITKANISPDVKHLRAQYEEGKSKASDITIQYQDNRIHDGDLLEKQDTQIAPYFQINSESDPEMPSFTLIMIDPDAPQRDHEVAGPWLHWIKSSLKRNDVHNGKTLADYQGPTPPDGTGPHQYIFLLYKSANDAISFDPEVIGADYSCERKRFQLQNFESANNLILVAATSFTVTAK